MQKFQDPRLADIIKFRDCDDLPREVTQIAYRKVRLLLACRSWGDVTFALDQIMETPNGYGVPLIGKWVLLFRWDDEDYAYALQLQRF